MKLYLWVIGIAMAVIAACNILFQTATWYYIVIAVVFCTGLQFAWDGLIAIAIHMMPNKWFRVGHPLYHVTKFERNLYKKLGVRRWKDKVWELGGLGGFSKKALEHPDNPEYIKQFIIECNKGVVTHRLAYPVGFLAMLLVAPPCHLTIALPVAVVNLFLSALPTIVLRHNTPMLNAMLQRMIRKGNT